MPKKTITAKFIADSTDYTTDWGTSLSTFGLFNAPPDLTETDIDGIISAIGATRDGELPPCNEVGGTLRKLRFIRKSGNTLSVPVNNRSNLLSAATVIKGILNTAGNEVVCIELLGEEYANLNDEMGISYQAGTTAPTHRAPSTALKQYYHAGNIEYSADSTSPIGGVVYQPIKSISNVENGPATQLGSVWDGCVGDFASVIPCPRGQGRSNPMKHRRFIVSFIVGTTEVDGSEQIEVPVKNYQASDVLSCGQNLAALDGAYCIGYRGESYRKFHKLLA
jgi:hypothetical protein